MDDWELMGDWELNGRKMYQKQKKNPDSEYPILIFMCLMLLKMRHWG